eukprot:Gregarina_sp_Poly_1__10320@NODE_72_length_15994_cov_120_491179_g62_i0_p2_GENE_NODE_72_length_15994_cov_120_491179_g62_i0NODE_72_length_15994_cov_120_491179_g62_i0_p2_ORF_typecomplete_len1331_score197_46IQ/PF00612_27/4_5e07IQ/PF00612_27/0_0005IQ/PF00612_27/0_026IQ/PF00612_27/0_00059AMPK1_CBM/PF16561_5/1_4e03AMPK1_CBM/PF16561_5/5_2e10_NODE_72_length_15994_cov_120_491179_g62_i0738711379
MAVEAKHWPAFAALSQYLRARSLPSELPALLRSPRRQNPDSRRWQRSGITATRQCGCAEDRSSIKCSRLTTKSNGFADRCVTHTKGRLVIGSDQRGAEETSRSDDEPITACVAQFECCPLSPFQTECSVDASLWESDSVNRGKRGSSLTLNGKREEQICDSSSLLLESSSESASCLKQLSRPLQALPINSCSAQTMSDGLDALAVVSEANAANLYRPALPIAVIAATTNAPRLSLPPPRQDLFCSGSPRSLGHISRRCHMGQLTRGSAEIRESEAAESLMNCRQHMDTDLFRSTRRRLISEDMADSELLSPLSKHYTLTPHGRQAFALLRNSEDTGHRRLLPRFGLNRPVGSSSHSVQEEKVERDSAGFTAGRVSAGLPSWEGVHSHAPPMSPRIDDMIYAANKTRQRFSQQRQLSPELLPGRSCLSDSNCAAPSECDGDTTTHPVTPRSVASGWRSMPASPEPVAPETPQRPSRRTVARPQCLFSKTVTPTWVLLMNRMFSIAAAQSAVSTDCKLDLLPLRNPASFADPLLHESSKAVPLFRPPSGQHSPSLLFTDCSSAASPVLDPAVSETPVAAGGNRVNKLEFLRLLYHEVAATTIQKHVRGHLARRKYELMRRQAAVDRLLNNSATKIQSLWRGYAARWEAMLRTHITMHEVCRQVAARRIQCAWRCWKARQELKVRQLADMLWRARQISAVTIQKAWRGYQVRNIVDEEWDHWVIKWIWDPPGKIVEVIGDFTAPAWIVRVAMHWCPIRRCYVAVLPRKQGRYELKFAVDGRFVCCGAGTVVEDGNGHYNNVVDVFEAQPESPFRRGRAILRALADKRRQVRISSASSLEKPDLISPLNVGVVLDVENDVSLGSVTPLQRTVKDNTAAAVASVCSLPAASVPSLPELRLGVPFVTQPLFGMDHDSTTIQQCSSSETGPGALSRSTGLSVNGAHFDQTEEDFVNFAGSTKGTTRTQSPGNDSPRPPPTLQSTPAPSDADDSLLAAVSIVDPPPGFSLQPLLLAATVQLAPSTCADESIIIPPPEVDPRLPLKPHPFLAESSLCVPPMMRVNPNSLCMPKDDEEEEDEEDSHLDSLSSNPLRDDDVDVAPLLPKRASFHRFKVTQHDLMLSSGLLVPAAVKDTRTVSEDRSQESVQTFNTAQDGHSEKADYKSLTPEDNSSDDEEALSSTSSPLESFSTARHLPRPSSSATYSDATENLSLPAATNIAGLPHRQQSSSGRSLNSLDNQELPDRKSTSDFQSARRTSVNSFDSGASVSAQPKRNRPRRRRKRPGSACRAPDPPCNASPPESNVKKRDRGRNKRPHRKPHNRSGSANGQTIQRTDKHD